MHKLEALLDAVASLNGFSNPDSYSYQIRNPLLIRSFSVPGKHEIDENGVRIFPTLLAGYRACLFDLEKKISGTSRAGIAETDTILNLLRVLRISEKLGQQQVIKFMRRALKSQDISLDTSLSFFR